MINFIRSFLAICHKDLLSESRRKEILNTLLFFEILVIFLFSFAIGPESSLIKKLAPSLLWLVVLFSSILALDRSFQTEMEEGCLEQLIICALSPRAIFLAKFLANCLFIGLVQIVVILMMFILYDLEPPQNPFQLAATFVLGDFGIAALGTFYAALITKTRARQAMLPLLLFPMLIPLLLSSVYATQAALQGDPFGQAIVWLKLLVVFDSVFMTACLMAIGPLMKG